MKQEYTGLTYGAVGFPRPLGISEAMIVGILSNSGRKGLLWLQDLLEKAGCSSASKSVNVYRQR
jgi:hypothetical protein